MIVFLKFLNIVWVNLIFFDVKSTNKHTHFICTGVCVYLRADTVDIVIWRTFFQFHNFTTGCSRLAALFIRLVFCTDITVLFLGRISCILLHVRFFCVNSLMSPYYTARYPVRTSHCQNVLQSKRRIVKTSPVKTSRFETKRPRWSKRPKSKRTNVRPNDLMQWLHSVTDCVVVIYTDRDSKFNKFLRSRKSRFFRNLKRWFLKFLKFVKIRDL